MNNYTAFGFITIILISIGQVMLKLATKTINISNKTSYTTIFMNLVKNKYLIIALFIYIVAAILWVYTLSKLDLSFAYFLISLSFPIVIVLSYYFLQENVTVYKIIGIFLIIIANVIILYGGS
jgi:drug/metabolite transporter (DMT)-like permease